MSKTLTLKQHIEISNKLQSAQETLSGIWQELQDAYPATKVAKEIKKLQRAVDNLNEVVNLLDDKLFVEQATARPCGYSHTIYFGSPSDREQNKLKVGL